MERKDWAGVTMLFALLYLISRGVGYISAMYGFFYGDIVFMVFVLVIAGCMLTSSEEETSDLLRRRSLAKRDKRITHNTELELVRERYISNRSVQDIADELGMSMMRVKKYMDEIDKESKII